MAELTEAEAEALPLLIQYALAYAGRIKWWGEYHRSDDEELQEIKETLEAFRERFPAMEECPTWQT